MKSLCLWVEIHSKAIVFNSPKLHRKAIVFNSLNSFNSKTWGKKWPVQLNKPSVFNRTAQKKTAPSEGSRKQWMLDDSDSNRE